MTFNQIVFEKKTIVIFNFFSFIACLLVSFMRDHIPLFWHSENVQPSIFWASTTAFLGFFITVSTTFSRKFFGIYCFCSRMKNILTMTGPNVLSKGAIKRLYDGRI